MLQTEIDKVSYSIGMNLGQSFVQQGVQELNFEALAQGAKDIFAKADLQISIQDANTIVQQFFTGLQEQKFIQNKTEGEDFLAENAKKEGIVTLPSGLQYEIIKEGDGPIPKETDTVKTHYHGTLINGTVFDSSIERDQPAVFPVNGVIKGWVEALQLMPVGSVWKLYIPTDLAYGANPHPNGPIEPHMALVFKIELLAIEG